MTIQDLLQKLNAENSESSEHAYILTVLIESKYSYQNDPQQDADLRSTLAPEFRNWRLSDDELELATTTLIDLILSSQNRSAQVVWALVRTYDPRALNALREVILADLSSRTSSRAGEAALYGITASNNHDFCVPLIRSVALEGIGDLQEQARHFIDVHSEFFRNG